LSTLTKVLIILLTISSIFLCGIVVTYVANAVDYKQKYDGLYQEYDAAKQNEDNANRRYNELKNQTDADKLALGNEIDSLKMQVGGLEAELNQAKIDRDDAQRRLNNWASIVQDFTATNEKQGGLLQKALDDLNRFQTALIEEQDKHKETTTALIEKLAVIALLEDKSAQLLEEKTELQNKLDQILRQFGKAVVAPAPVRAIADRARLAPPTRDIGLKGLITVVDLKSLLAQVSIGAADGVKEGTRFHATRGDKFVCDIVIFDVQPDKAVGWLELLQPENQPKVGDNVSTNL
jgi:hypothetical protein